MIEQWKRWMLTRGYSLSTISSYGKGAQLYAEFLETNPTEEIDYDFDGIILTNHAKERLAERLGIPEDTFIALLYDAKHEPEYQDYEPEKAQHLFKVAIPAFSLSFIGAIDQNGVLIIITIL